MEPASNPKTPRRDELKAPLPPGRQSSGSRSPRLHPRAPSSETPLTPSGTRARASSGVVSSKLAVTPPSPSHRRAQSADICTEIVDIPTPTTRTRSGFAARPGSKASGSAQQPLSLLSPHSRAKQRWTSAAQSVAPNTPKTFADIVLESRRIRASPKAMDGGFRELVVLLAAIKRNKGVSAEQSYKLKSMMLSRDPEEFQRAKDFLERLDQYTQQNNVTDSVHAQYPHLNELDDVSKIIYTPEGYHSFFSFLQSEYSQENLLFWRAVKDFERAFASDKPSDEIKEHAMRLWNSYIGPQSENTINLSSGTVSGFQEQLFSKSRFSTDLLFQACEAAKTDIEQLLSRDSFQRYKKSPLYAKLCEDAKTYHNSPQKKRRGGSDLIKEFFGHGTSA